jgi:DNA end-binding protein Ku
MRFAEELLPADEIAPAETKEASPREKQLALHLVDELSGPFDPGKHPDEYRSAVLAAVDEKVEAGELARDTTEEAEQPAAVATGAQVIDLAELLSRSIKVANKPGPAKAMPEETKAEGAQRTEKAKGSKKKRATG